MEVNYDFCNPNLWSLLLLHQWDCDPESAVLTSAFILQTKCHKLLLAVLFAFLMQFTPKVHADCLLPSRYDHLGWFMPIVAVCVCVCVCVCACVSVCMYVYVHAHVYVCVCAVRISLDRYSLLFSPAIVHHIHSQTHA